MNKRGRWVFTRCTEGITHLEGDSQSVSSSACGIADDSGLIVDYDASGPVTCNACRSKADQIRRLGAPSTRDCPPLRGARRHRERAPMITREEAAMTVEMHGDSRIRDLARTVVALYDNATKLTDERDAARIVLQQLAPLDRVEWTWPDDFPDGEKPDCLCSACGDAVLVETGHEWAQGRDVCHDCAAMRSEALSAVTRERDALRENQRDALKAIQATAESAEKYAAKADALALELRRLRAAEAPGTDDEAFAGTGWDWLDGAWVHVSGPVVGMDEEGLWTSDDVAQRNELALDAMRAAVPGSV